MLVCVGVCRCVLVCVGVCLCVLVCVGVCMRPGELECLKEKERERGSETENGHSQTR